MIRRASVNKKRGRLSKKHGRKARIATKEGLEKPIVMRNKKNLAKQ